jgi:ATP-dependent DNA ligase
MWVKPQLYKLVDAPPQGPEWLHEIKYDGYRMHARLDRGKAQLLTRAGLDWTHKYPRIVTALSVLPAKQAYLDGELCGHARSMMTALGEEDQPWSRPRFCCQPNGRRAAIRHRVNS